MLPIRLGPTSFHYGPLEIAYADVLGAGIGIRPRRFRTLRSLVIAYRMAGDPRPRKLLFRLDDGVEHRQLVEGVRAHVADRWIGEAGLFELNRRLGFSNRRVFAVVAALVVLACLITAAALVATRIAAT